MRARNTIVGDTMSHRFLLIGAVRLVVEITITSIVYSICTNGVNKIGFVLNARIIVITGSHTNVRNIILEILVIFALTSSQVCPNTWNSLLRIPRFCFILSLLKMIRN